MQSVAQLRCRHVLCGFTAVMIGRMAPAHHITRVSSLPATIIYYHLFTCTNCQPRSPRSVIVVDKLPYYWLTAHNTLSGELLGLYNHS